MVINIFFWGIPLAPVTAFMYLGHVLSADNNDWPVVVGGPAHFRLNFKIIGFSYL